MANPDSQSEPAIWQILSKGAQRLLAQWVSVDDGWKAVILGVVILLAVLLDIRISW